jgi:hypothetical protein
VGRGFSQWGIAWRPCEEVEDGLPDGRHAWWWRRFPDSFFRLAALRRRNRNKAYAIMVIKVCRCLVAWKDCQLSVVGLGNVGVARGTARQHKERDR